MQPEEAVRLLMNDGISFATKMLRESGEFHPYARTLSRDLAIIDIAAFDGEDKPEGASQLELLESGLRAKVSEDSDIAVATFTNVKLRLDDEKPVDAVQIGLEHRQGYSINVYFPYSIKKTEVSFGDPIPTQRDSVVFA